MKNTIWGDECRQILRFLSPVYDNQVLAFEQPAALLLHTEASGNLDLWPIRPIQLAWQPERSTHLSRFAHKNRVLRTIRPKCAHFRFAHHEILCFGILLAICLCYGHSGGRYHEPKHVTPE